MPQVPGSVKNLKKKKKKNNIPNQDFKKNILFGFETFTVIIIIIIIINWK